VRRPPGPWRLLATAVAALAAAGCDLPGFGAPDPKAEEGESIFSLWQGFFLTAMAVGALVWGLLIFVIVRYRRRDDTIPGQSPYNIPVEIAYTVAPILLVGVLFAFSVAAEDDATRIAPDPVAHIDVVGFQWSWQFVYTDEDITITGEPGEPPEMVVPVGRPVELRLVSADVNHSFWVPDFLSKRDLIPGVDNEISITPTETGSYVGRCAEYCGLDHWRMNYTVRVVPEDEYEAWLDDQQAGGDETAGDGG
jgi:cytochrome c oxidase subunit 2